MRIAGGGENAATNAGRFFGRPEKENPGSLGVGDPGRGVLLRGAGGKFVGYELR